jgi:hypothetical protein
VNVSGESSVLLATDVHVGLSGRCLPVCCPSVSESDREVQMLSGFSAA